MGLSDIWDSILDGLDYFFHFEWLGDFFEAVGETFSSLGELSTYGILFGSCGVVLVFLLKKWLLNPFLEFMSPGSAVITTILSFVATFVACYLIGKRFEDTG